MAPTGKRLRRAATRWVRSHIERAVAQAIDEGDWGQVDPMDALAERIEAIHLDLHGLRSDLSAVRQSLSLLARDLEDIEAPPPLMDDPPGQAPREDQIEMIRGAQSTLSKHLEEVAHKVEEAEATNQQAQQAATTARSTAEAAVDGLIGVESELAALKTRLAK